MSYTPQNQEVFIAVYSAALAGMAISDRIPRDDDPNSYSGLAAVAGAFAEEFDTQWGVQATTSLDIQLARTSVQAIWQSRAVRTTDEYLEPSLYTPECEALIAVLHAADSYFTAESIDPDIPTTGAVIFDGGGTPITGAENARTDRQVNQSPIDNTKDGIVNLGSDVDHFANGGALANFATIGGGDGNAVLGNYATVPGGQFNRGEGDGSFAVGINSRATREYAVAMGHTALASQPFAAAIGENVTASGQGAVAMGDSCNATASGAVAMGLTNNATDSGAVALGNGTTASGNGAVALGVNTQATAIAANAEGSDTQATGQYAHAEGLTTIASGISSHARGTQCTASGHSSTAMGINALARLNTQVAHSCDPTGTTNAGERQYTRLVLRGTTPGDAGNESVDLKYYINSSLTLEDGKAYLIRVDLMVAGVNLGTGDKQYFGYTNFILVNQVAGVASVLGSFAEDTITSADLADATFGLSAAAGPARILATFTTGVTAVQTEAVATFHMTEVPYPVVA